VTTTPTRAMGQAYGALSAGAALVAEARHDLDAIGAELRRRIDDTGVSWCGRGGEAFTTFGHAWSDRQASIVGALDHFESALRATEHVNVATDDDQSAALARYRQQLG
jgi:uncharacterized protein YukE